MTLIDISILETYIFDFNQFYYSNNICEYEEQHPDIIGLLSLYYGCWFGKSVASGCVLTYHHQMTLLCIIIQSLSLQFAATKLWLCKLRAFCWLVTVPDTTCQIYQNILISWENYASNEIFPIFE